MSTTDKEMHDAIKAIVAAALKYDEGCDILDHRLDMLDNGVEFGPDELDEIDIEKIMGALDIRSGVKKLKALIEDGHEYS